jgi:hypothetical protein
MRQLEPCFCRAELNARAVAQQNDALRGQAQLHDRVKNAFSAYLTLVRIGGNQAPFAHMTG